MFSSTTRMGPVAAVAAFAVSKGLPLERITEATGLTLADFIQPERRLPDRLVGVIWQLLFDAFPGEPVTLEMARMAPFDFFGPLAHVASHAETLRDVLDAFVRYRRIMSSALHLELRDGPDTVEMVMSHPLDTAAPTPAPEMVVALTMRMVREMMGVDDALVRVEFTHAPIAPQATYTAFFGVDVLFERPANTTTMNRAAVDRSLPNGNAPRFDWLTRHLDTLHDELVGADDSTALMRVRAGIAHNARRGEYGADALARHLGVGVRSLQRTVRSEGTTLRVLIDDARQNHARRLLGDPKLSIEEVAFLLGYSAESAFRRAFKRWTGHSPAEVRRAG